MRAFVTCGALALMLTSATTAWAEPIRIVSGSLTYLGGASFTPLELAGTSGFTFVGRPGTGLFAPADCNVPACVPGTSVSLLARWSGGDLGGTATLNGVRYERVGSASTHTSLNVEFTGSFFVPATAGDSAILTTPFSFEGTFFIDAFPDRSVFTLLGGGVATAQLVRYMNTNAWRVGQLQYAFVDPAAIPEGSTLLLISIGGAVLAWRRRANRQTPLL